ncbi:hypothetical protein FQN54_004498 [Arachnomyces sp. PD_36]|nr:hypothetical protein FQN54_004498 [Arachnomyces sp. PD_36]
MADQTEFSRFLLPGFSLPLTFSPKAARDRRRWVDGEIRTEHEPGTGEGRNLFSNALDCEDEDEPRSAMPLTTLRELTMLQLMNEVTDKPGWETKEYYADSIELQRDTWKEEMTETELDVTEAMVDYVIGELRYKAEVFRKTGLVNVYTGDVVKSDGVIPPSLRDQLKTFAARLEDVPEVKKDYHPGSDELVLDLVHPSLFPLIYGRSRILPDSLVTLDNCIDKCGSGLTTELAPESKPAPPGGGQPVNPYSYHFQWLPCEVEFMHEEGSQPGQNDELYPRCKITSYINNLHPHHHADLYRCIEGIISRVIPQWNRTLGPLEREEFPDTQRIKYSECTYEDDWGEEPEQKDEETMADLDLRFEEWLDKRDEHIEQPEPPEFSAPAKTEEQFDLRRTYGHRGLQVIVKLANIQLTPEKPKYEGGTWHIEGQKNEHICATALYYYDSENITESRLAFRHQVYGREPTVSYEQNHNGWLKVVFGVENDEPPIQNVGDIECREGRVITFPNVLQHRVQPFELQDATRPGHRKILALFLVDPNIRIISTANVPPQQRDWWGEEVKSTSVINSLPVELQEEVVRAVDDFPIGMEEAKEIRLELMDERKHFVVTQTEAFKSGEFSLCEH